MQSAVSNYLANFSDGCATCRSAWRTMWPNCVRSLRAQAGPRAASVRLRPRQGAGTSASSYAESNVRRRCVATRGSPPSATRRSQAEIVHRHHQPRGGARCTHGCDDRSLRAPLQTKPNRWTFPDEPAGDAYRSAALARHTKSSGIAQTFNGRSICTTSDQGYIDYRLRCQHASVEHHRE